MAVKQKKYQQLANKLFWLVSVHSFSRQHPSFDFLHNPKQKFHMFYVIASRCWQLSPIVARTKYSWNAVYKIRQKQNAKRSNNKLSCSQIGMRVWIFGCDIFAFPKIKGSATTKSITKFNAINQFVVKRNTSIAFGFVLLIVLAVSFCFFPFLLSFAHFKCSILIHTKL